MMNPAESFVIAIARASRRKSYYLRGLKSTDQDDVRATALAWCWENRAQYDPKMALEKWFDKALQEARSAWFGQGDRKKPDATVTAQEFNEMMADSFPDPVAEEIERKQALDALLRQLLPEERFEVRAILSGERIRLSATLRGKLQGRKFADLLPREKLERKKVMRAVIHPNYDNVRDLPAPRIDLEIAQLTAMPQHGADCIPCWRCMWHQGFMPAKYVRRQTVVDVGVQAAIWNVEERKIEIAAKLQAGTIQFIGVAR